MRQIACQQWFGGNFLFYAHEINDRILEDIQTGRLRFFLNLPEF